MKTKNPFGMTDEVIASFARMSRRSFERQRKYFSKIEKEIKSSDYVPPPPRTLPEIFSNVANKSLKKGFDKVEREWKRIAKLRKAGKPVPERKLTTGLSLRDVLMATVGNRSDDDLEKKVITAAFGFPLKI